MKVAGKIGVGVALVAGSFTAVVLYFALSGNSPKEFASGRSGLSSVSNPFDAPSAGSKPTHQRNELIQSALVIADSPDLGVSIAHARLWTGRGWQGLAPDAEGNLVVFQERGILIIGDHGAEAVVAWRGLTNRYTCDLTPFLGGVEFVWNSTEANSFGSALPQLLVTGNAEGSKLRRLLGLSSKSLHSLPQLSQSKAKDVIDAVVQGEAEGPSVGAVSLFNSRRNFSPATIRWTNLPATATFRFDFHQRYFQKVAFYSAAGKVAPLSHQQYFASGAVVPGVVTSKIFGLLENSVVFGEIQTGNPGREALVSIFDRRYLPRADDPALTYGSDQQEFPDTLTEQLAFSFEAVNPGAKSLRAMWPTSDGLGFIAHSFSLEPGERKDLGVLSADLSRFVTVTLIPKDKNGRELDIESIYSVGPGETIYGKVNFSLNRGDHPESHFSFSLPAFPIGVPVRLSGIPVGNFNLGFWPSLVGLLPSRKLQTAYEYTFHGGQGEQVLLDFVVEGKPPTQPVYFDFGNSAADGTVLFCTFQNTSSSEIEVIQDTVILQGGRNKDPVELPQGNYRAFALNDHFSKSNGSWCSNFIFEVNPSLGLVNANLQQANTISGVLVGDDSEPRSGTFILRLNGLTHPLDSAKFLAMLSIGADGKFTLKGIPKGVEIVDFKSGGFLTDVPNQPGLYYFH